MTASSAFTIEDALFGDQDSRQLMVEWEGNTIRQVKGFRIHLPLTSR